MIIMLNHAQAPDAPPAAAASLAGRSVGKVVVDQSSARDTHAEADRTSPVKAAAAPSPRPVLDAPASIWEKLASHEVSRKSLSVCICTQVLHVSTLTTELAPFLQPVYGVIQGTPAALENRLHAALLLQSM